MIWKPTVAATALVAAMNLIGVGAGTPYPPYSPLTADETSALAALLKTTVLGHRLLVQAAE